VPPSLPFYPFCAERVEGQATVSPLGNFLGNSREGSNAVVVAVRISVKNGLPGRG